MVAARKALRDWLQTRSGIPVHALPNLSFSSNTFCTQAQNTGTLSVGQKTQQLKAISSLQKNELVGTALPWSCLQLIKCIFFLFCWHYPGRVVPLKILIHWCTYIVNDNIITCLQMTSTFRSRRTTYIFINQVWGQFLLPFHESSFCLTDCLMVNGRGVFVLMPKELMLCDQRSWIRAIEPVGNLLH